MSYLFSSESVCAGHPDKICDQISDAIVDEALKIYSNSRVAVETLVTANQVVLAGEVSCSKEINYEDLARKVIRELGYTKAEYGFSDMSQILVKIHHQSPDIATGVDQGGAGDQGLMFGYACKQTVDYMPLPVMVAHSLTRGMDDLAQELSWLRPDGKAQVTIEYEGRKPKLVHKIVLARPHNPTFTVDEVKNTLYEKVVKPVTDVYGLRLDLDQLIVNGTGKWEIGGPASDTGVTGRKIIVDTYGGWSRHGGGCFSGKDATKVDRSAAYAARWVAKNIVAQGLALECEIQVAYVIGQAAPVSMMIETFGTAKKSDKIIRSFIDKMTSFEVEGIIERLELRQPIYKPTAVYGHFGKKDMSWERIID